MAPLTHLGVPPKEKPPPPPPPPVPAAAAAAEAKVPAPKEKPADIMAAAAAKPQPRGLAVRPREQKARGALPTARASAAPARQGRQQPCSPARELQRGTLAACERSAAVKAARINDGAESAAAHALARSRSDTAFRQAPPLPPDGS